MKPSELCRSGNSKTKGWSAFMTGGLAVSVNGPRPRPCPARVNEVQIQQALYRTERQLSLALVHHILRPLRPRSAETVAWENAVWKTPPKNSGPSLSSFSESR